MDETQPELLISLSLEDGDAEELDALSRQLRGEIEEMHVDSVEQVSQGPAPAGSKAADWASIGQLAVTLAPTLIPSLFDLLKSWTQRRPTTPVKIRVKVGKTRTAQIEYDPTTTSPEQLEAILKALGRPLRKS
jgi:hypothetical protein